MLHSTANMDQENYKNQKRTRSFRRKEWRFIHDFPVIFMCLLVIILQTQFVQSSVDIKESPRLIDNKKTSNLNNDNCHNCPPSVRVRQSEDDEFNATFEDRRYQNSIHETENGLNETFLDKLLTKIEVICEKMVAKSNKTEDELEQELFESVEESLKSDYYKIIDGVEIQPLIKSKAERKSSDIDVSFNASSRAIFSKFGFERKLFNRIRTFFENHILSISLPKAARFFGLRSFGLKKLLVPILIGAQVLKSVLIAMFLPSILGSFGKIVGKGLSHLSASSSQASYPPVMEEQGPYGEDPGGNKDIMGYETDPQGVYAYPQDHQQNMFATANDINSLSSDVTMSRYGPGGAKVTYLPAKNGDYYKNQIANTNYKVFHKIPASSMILSNYDPFYSPLLSRLDGIFARLGLTPAEGSEAAEQTVSSVKLEACREQLVCLMYASPAKYAPYSNLVSAQLSRELNELRRPTSDNPEILRFFRYMRAARQGQEGADCVRAHPACAVPAQPAHTMIAAYHDMNKLVTARKLQ